MNEPDAPSRLPLREKLLRWASTPPGEITLAAAFLFTLVMAVFGPVLFGPGDIVLSNADADLASQFVHWRAFGFRELRAGHLALWNPHIYSGAPYFGGFQSALLYPPNWLYLCLPLARAINIGLALHVFLAGFFMFLWTRHRALHPLACVLAGVLFMFCGPYFPHIYAGHLPNLCTMVWAPLIFLAIDGWMAQRTPGWLLLGVTAIAMQILAGHPQYVYYTGVAAALYCLLGLLKTPRPVLAAAGLGIMVAGAVGLTAVQLFEGFHAAGQSVRSVGTSVDFAALFSFPPENFLTLLAPGFFGDMTGSAYWGRCYLWEMSLFFGVSGLVLALYGAFHGSPFHRRSCVTLSVILLVLALGGHTPLFRWLYLYAPGFNKFRGWSKFTFPAILFLITLAASGFDRMLRHGLPGRRFPVAILAAGAGLLVLAALAFASAPGRGEFGPRPWAFWMEAIHDSGEQFAPPTHLWQPLFVRDAAVFAAKQLVAAGAALLTLGAIFLASLNRPRALLAVLAIATLEMLAFAWSTVDTFRLGEATDTLITRFLRGVPAGDYRVLAEEHADLAMSIGAHNVWGYDPGLLLRYAEWMAASQGADPDTANQGRSFYHLPPIFPTLLRCRYVLALQSDAKGNESLKVGELQPSDSPRLRLISRVRLLNARKPILAAINDPAFDAEHEVILETPPDPPPAPAGPSGAVRVVSETTDSLTIEARLPQPAILLVTDTYCTGWQATSLLPARDAAQPRYTVLPADYCFRAIPLAAGFHRLLLEYRPRAFIIGQWTTIISLALYLAAGSRVLTSRRHRSGSFPPATLSCEE